MKNNKGITLIALIITIIILLILAVVTINIIQNSGLIKRSKEAIDKHELEDIKEKFYIATSTLHMQDLNFFTYDDEKIFSGLNPLLENKLLPFNISGIPRDDSYFYCFYNGKKQRYLCITNKKSLETLVSQYAMIDPTPTPQPPNPPSIDDIDPTLPSIANNNMYQNVLYASNFDLKPYNNSEITWYAINDTDKDVKLAAQTYCGNNLMYYDGNTSPFIPVAVRFYREDTKTSWPSKKERGLNYFNLEYDNNFIFSTASTQYTNAWSFIKCPKGEGTGLEYNYDTTSERNCSSTTSANPSFKDLEAKHFYAFGRLTYSGTPSSTVTDLGSITSTIADADNYVLNLPAVGSNFVIDLRQYYSTLNEAKDLVKNTTDSRYKDEIALLTQAFWNAVNINFNTCLAVNPNKDFKDVVIIYGNHIDNSIKNVQDKIKLLHDAMESNIEKVPDTIKNTVEKASKIDFSVPTIEVDGGSNLVYTSGLNSSSTATENLWNVGDINLAFQAYCADNILIYDGINELYVPVMLRFYRQDKNTSWPSKKPRGLKYVITSSPNHTTLSTSNGFWNWVKVSNNNGINFTYNYNQTPEMQCNINVSEEKPNFTDSLKSGHYYACGRLTYNSTPENILTNLGSFSATACDQDGNLKDNSSGSNYIIDVTNYYKTFKEAQELLTFNNLYTNYKAVESLALYLIDLSNKEDYTFNNANTFANEIDNLTAGIESEISKCKNALH